MQIARIKLSSTDMSQLDAICKEIKMIAEKTGVSIAGPIPLPTKKLRVSVLKTPCGDGTGHGNATWDKWEMRVHKRIVDIGANERALRQIMRVNIPENVQIEIELKE
ncbi:MAG: 30S ribosomal protein S10 [Candidatus Aenigmarchaeota archaeon]|nr:30S ribosomal protein S10 [Candidatus Aenigmarchaeota archaeon]